MTVLRLLAAVTISTAGLPIILPAAALLHRVRGVR